MNTKWMVPLVAALAVAACADGAGPSGADLTAAELAEVSNAMIETGFDATSDAASADAPVSGGIVLDALGSTGEFSVTRACPLGGQVVIEGTRTRTWDRETQTGSGDLEVTKTHDDCVRPLRRGDGSVTLNGDPNIAVAAHHEWAAGQRSGLQTMTMTGGFTWVTDDGREGACVIDIEAAFDPETRTRTVTGTFCDRTIDSTVTWTGMGVGGGHGM